MKRLFEVACLVEGGGPKAQSCVADQQQHQFDDVAKVIQAASSKEEGVWALFYMLRHKIKVGDSEMSLIAEVPAVPKSSSGLPLSMAKNAEAIFPDDDDSQDAPASPKEEEQPSMAEAPATQAASPKKQPWYSRSNQSGAECHPIVGRQRVVGGAAPYGCGHRPAPRACPPASRYIEEAVQAPKRPECQFV